MSGAGAVWCALLCTCTERRFGEQCGTQQHLHADIGHTNTHINTHSISLCLWLTDCELIKRTLFPRGTSIVRANWKLTLMEFSFLFFVFLLPYSAWTKHTFNARTGNWWRISTSSQIASTKVHFSVGGESSKGWNWKTHGLLFASPYFDSSVERRDFRNITCRIKTR